MTTDFRLEDDDWNETTDSLGIAHHVKNLGVVPDCDVRQEIEYSISAYLNLKQQLEAEEKETDEQFQNRNREEVVEQIYNLLTELLGERAVKNMDERCRAERYVFGKMMKADEYGRGFRGPNDEPLGERGVSKSLEEILKGMLPDFFRPQGNEPNWTWTEGKLSISPRQWLTKANAGHPTENMLLHILIQRLDELVWKRTGKHLGVGNKAKSFVLPICQIVEPTITKSREWKVRNAMRVVREEVVPLPGLFDRVLRQRLSQWLEKEETENE
jgi:hypothetical protein